MVFVAVIVGFCWDSLLLLLLLFLYSVQFRFDGLYLLFHLPSHFARLCIYENIRNIRNLVRVWMNEWMGELSVHLDLAWNFTFCINKIFRGILMVRTIDRTYTTESIYYEWKTAIAITEYVSFWAGVYATYKPANVLILSFGQPQTFATPKNANTRTPNDIITVSVPLL